MKKKFLEIYMPLSILFGPIFAKKKFLEIYIPLSIVFGPILTLFNGNLILDMGISMGIIIGVHSLMLYLKKTKSLKKMQEATDDESSER